MHSIAHLSMLYSARIARYCSNSGPNQWRHVTILHIRWGITTNTSHARMNKRSPLKQGNTGVDLGASWECRRPPTCRPSWSSWGTGWAAGGRSSRSCHPWTAAGRGLPPSTSSTAWRRSSSGRKVAGPSPATRQRGVTAEMAVLVAEGWGQQS